MLETKVSYKDAVWTSTPSLMGIYLREDLADPVSRFPLHQVKPALMVWNSYES